MCAVHSHHAQYGVYTKNSFKWVCNRFGVNENPLLCTTFTSSRKWIVSLGALPTFIGMGAVYELLLLVFFEKYCIQLNVFIGHGNNVGSLNYLYRVFGIRLYSISIRFVDI